MLSPIVNQWIDKKEGGLLWKFLYKPCQVLFNEGFIIFLKLFFFIIYKEILKLKAVYYYDPIIQKKINFKKEVKHKRRKPGISGFMRVKNEEDFLARVIDSVIEGLDELVIVYNDCNDKTPKIIEEYKNKYPLKIKVYHYLPKVYPQGSNEYEKLEYCSPYSLVNYYNFALAKTNFEIAVKIDGDDFFIAPLFNKVTNNIRKYGINEFLMFSGVNLWDDKGEIYINGNLPIIGGYRDRDRGFFPVSTSTFHIKNKIFEQFVCRLKFVDIGLLFYHLKGMKKDRGLGIYNLEHDSDSYGHILKKRFYSEPTLFEWDNFKESENLMQFIPRPLYKNISIFNRKN